MASYGLGSLLSIDDLLWCSSQVSAEDAVWIPETWGMECFGIMSAVAHRSRCGRIGSSILNVYSRSPASLAMGAATIDHISGGRLVLGLGVSSPAIVQNLHGIPYERPLQRMRESIQIVRQALGGGQINHSGPVFDTKGFTLMVRPRSGAVPVYVAAVNRRMSTLAWEMADGVIFYLRPPGELRDTVRSMQETRRIKVACQIITAVSDDAEAAYDRARKTLAFYVSVGDVYREFLASNGYRGATERIYGEYRRGGLRRVHQHVPDDMLHELTACGTPAECRKAIAAISGAGVDEPILQFNPTGDVRESFQMLTGLN